MEINLFIYLAAIFLAAYGTKGLTSWMRIPEVTGYVLLGVLFGTVGFLNEGVLEHLESLTSIALGIISFLIGIELRWDVIKKLGRSIGFIVFFEVVFTFAVVFLALFYGLGADLNMSLLLGAVASATAPAATVAVIRQYKARGPLTSTILAVVGLDDALALIVYVFVQAFVSASLLGQRLQPLQTLGTAALSVVIALGIGALGALVFVVMLRRIRNNDWILMFLAAAIFGLLGLTQILGVSELLAIMMFGAVVVNGSPILAKKGEGLMEAYSPLFLALFFILGGAHLDIRLVGSLGILGLAYFFARTLGKVSGATLGAYLGRAQKSVRNRIGFSLLPQVGVALALALATQREFTQTRYGQAGIDLAVTVINILLMTTVLTEIIGPLLTRRALKKAGEVDQAP